MRSNNKSDEETVAMDLRCWMRRFKFKKQKSGHSKKLKGNKISYQMGERSGDKWRKPARTVVW